MEKRGVTPDEAERPRDKQAQKPGGVGDDPVSKAARQVADRDAERAKADREKTAREADKPAQ